MDFQKPSGGSSNRSLPPCYLLLTFTATAVIFNFCRTEIQNMITWLAEKVASGKKRNTYLIFAEDTSLSDISDIMCNLKSADLPYQTHTSLHNVHQP